MSIAQARALGLAFCTCAAFDCNCGTLRPAWAPVCPDCLDGEHVTIPTEAL